MVAGQVPEFELHSMTAKQAMIFEKMLEYSELLLSPDRERLCTTNPQNQKSIAEQILVCQAALDSFAIQKWLDDSLADIKFLSA